MTPSGQWDLFDCCRRGQSPLHSLVGEALPHSHRETDGILSVIGERAFKGEIIFPLM